MDDDKKYNFLENILQKLNQKYIALPEDEIKRNNQLVMKIIKKIIDRMISKSVLFRNLYQNIYYGGSYYDGLKVGQPSEYDLDCVLRMPKIVEPSVKVSDKPGYVHVELTNLEVMLKKVDETPKYPGLQKLLDGDCNRLSAKKVRGWMEGLMTSIWEPTINGVNLKFRKSGPALTIKLEGAFEGKSFDIDVDVVPCFTFFDDQWPEGYKTNPFKKTKNTFFVVPKSPSIKDVHYWRLSFQEQEREMINDFRVMKPTIRLIKKIRDRYKHDIASYFIKTVFLWELDKFDRTFWEKSLTHVFLTMLKKYCEYISEKKIPYYWNPEYNLIGDLSDKTAFDIANKIRNIIQEIDRKCFNEPYCILNYFLTLSEDEIEIFKVEVPLPKKFLKRPENSNNPPKIQEIAVAAEETRLLTSTPSSVASSFEDLNKDVNDTQEKSTLKCPQEENLLQNLLATMVSNQEKIMASLEQLCGKIDEVTSVVKVLCEKIEARITENENERREVVTMVNMMNKKLDDIVKTVEMKYNIEDDPDLFTPIEDILKRSADYVHKE